jgi:hypothetical protein
MKSPGDTSALIDPDEACLATLESKVLGHPQLSRLAAEWMLGTSRSLEDFITYNRHLIEAGDFPSPPPAGTTGPKG